MEAGKVTNDTLYKGLECPQMWVLRRCWEGQLHFSMCPFVRTVIMLMLVILAPCAQHCDNNNMANYQTVTTQETLPISRQYVCCELSLVIHFTTTILRLRSFYHYTHFTYGETETQGSQLPQISQRARGKLSSNPGPEDSETCPWHHRRRHPCL